ALRAPLGRAEEALSRVASALAAELALLERGGDRSGDARRIRTLDSLTQIADERMLVAGVQARRDLLDRRQALQLAAGEGVPAGVVRVGRRALRAAKLLRGLLRCVRVTDQEVTRVNLNDAVRGAMDLVSYRFVLDEITVGGRLDPGLVAVEGDAIKLEQVVVNLLSNAIDALRAISPPRELTVDTWCEGARVSVAVEDNARGVAAEMVPRLFR